MFAKTELNIDLNNDVCIANAVDCSLFHVRLSSCMNVSIFGNPLGITCEATVIGSIGRLSYQKNRSCCIVRLLDSLRTRT